MNDVSISLEHVDLLDGLDWLDVELLEGSLKLLVIGTGVSVDLLHLPSWGTLSSIIRPIVSISSSLSSQIQVFVELRAWCSVDFPCNLTRGMSYIP